jgi:hypothetical protein
VAATKRSSIKREFDLATLAGLYFKGKFQSEIASQLNLTQQQISYDLKTLQTRWAESARGRFDDAKGKELAKVDNLEREYWQAYQLSQKDFRSVTAKRERVDLGIDKDGKRAARKGAITELTVKKETRIGDPRYLAGVAWCIERRCKILGLDAPIQTETAHSFSEENWVNIRGVILTALSAFPDARVAVATSLLQLEAGPVIGAVEADYSESEVAE